MTIYRPGVPRNRRTLTVLIRDDPNDLKCHHNGVNALQYDPYEKRLYSAGRDSVIRAWNVGASALAKNQLSTQIMEHHTDWVNDIVLCMNGKNIVSASSDCTVKVWNVSRGFCMSTLRTHRDYVKSLAYAKEREMVASAGFDRQIFLWDVGKLLQLTATNNTINTQNLIGASDSIYSLCMNPTATVCIAGTSEMSLMVWDPRTQNLTMKLKGHSDIVKTVVVSPDGSQAISGSSDGLIKLWSLGEQRCLETFRIHEDSVWTLKTDPNFTMLYSGGRDGYVYETDLSLASADDCFASRAIIKESSPVLSMQFGDSAMKSLWVSTTASHIRKWSIPERKLTQNGDTRNTCNSNSVNDYESIYNDDDAYVEILTPAPGANAPSANSGGASVISDSGQTSEPSMDSLAIAPSFTIEGKPALKKYHVLNNKRHILTQDVDGVVCKWDVLLGKKENILGKCNFEEEVKKQFKFIYVPNWFSVDLKTGILCIHVDEIDCLQSWVSAKELGMKQRLVESAENDKVHYANLLVQALLEKWPESRALKTSLELAAMNTTGSASGGIPTGVSSHHHSSSSAHSTSTSNSQDIPYSPHSANQKIGSEEHLHSQQMPPVPGGSSGRQSRMRNSSSSCSSTGNSSSTVRSIGNNYFSLPDHTVFIINEIPSGKAVGRFIVSNCDRDIESQNLKDMIPEWVRELVVEGVSPKFHKLAFFLLPHPNFNSKIHNNKKDRLSANDLLQVRKILEHVVEKILKPDTGASSATSEQYSHAPGTGATHPPGAQGGTGGGATGGPGAFTAGGMSLDELNEAVNGLDLICNDIVLDLSWDLRTIKHFIWRGSSGDLTLYFKQKDKDSSGGTNGTGNSKK